MLFEAVEDQFEFLGLLVVDEFQEDQFEFELGRFVVFVLEVVV